MAREIKVDPEPVTLTAKTLTAIERDELIRQTLELAAKRLETHYGNDLYRQAWRTGARIVRTMKP